MAVNHLDIIEGTIRCAYKVGLPAVTMSLIGKEVGILAQGLYNHFDSKDDILNACFDYCKQQIGNLYKGYILDPQDSLDAAVKKLWNRYFTYFINHPAECAFYRNYREMNSSLRPPQDVDEPYLKDFWSLLDELEKLYGKRLNVPRKSLLYYLRNLTPYLARAVSEGIMEDTPVVREQLWQMTFGGLASMY